jgi:hypothetical protein
MYLPFDDAGFRMIEMATQTTAAGDPPEPAVPAALLDEIEREIRRLRRFSSRGLWALALFLLVCILVGYGAAPLLLPERIVAALGKPPSPWAISLLLVVYTFFAIILSLSRFMGGIEHRSSFCHVGYLTAFFLFYHGARALDDNYWAVVGAGITILGVESYRIWSYCSEAIAKKQTQLVHVRKTGRMPVED